MFALHAVAAIYFTVVGVAYVVGTDQDDVSAHIKEWPLFAWNFAAAALLYPLIVQVASDAEKKWLAGGAVLVHAVALPLSTVGTTLVMSRWLGSDDDSGSSNYDGLVGVGGIVWTAVTAIAMGIATTLLPYFPSSSSSISEENEKGQ